MKFLVSFFAGLALAAASPSVLAPAPVAYVAPAPVVPAPVVPATGQYHTQDSLGQYAYGYATGESAKNEFRAFDGSTHGAYSYVDADGILQSVNYVADENGFRVAGTNIPASPLVAPVHTYPAPAVAYAAPAVAYGAPAVAYGAPAVPHLAPYPAAYRYVL